MCGIFGKLFFNKTKIDPKEYGKNLNSLCHRGPDDFGFYTDNNIILASRRLAIIDLSPKGHMPMSNEDGSLWIISNGEIYNFLDLRKRLERKHKFRSKTDTEVILHLYEEKGTECLKELRGMFAFAIWDEKKKELFIARDRLGKKPVKFYSNNTFFIFASELKAILKDPSVLKEIDYEAIDEYLTYQYVPSPRTGFKNIYKLEPAYYLIIKSTGEIIKKRYWHLDFNNKLNLKEEEWQETTLNKLKESVRLRLRSDVSLGAHLSGGIDSSLVVALMSQELGKPIKTFSVGFKEVDYNELPYVRGVIERYKTDHHQMIVEPDAVNILPKLIYYYEEPYGDPSALPTWYLCQITKKEVTVALNGDGGDENFAGYQRYNLFKAYYQLIKKLPFKNFIENVNQNIYQLTKIKLFRKIYRFLEAYTSDEILFYLRLIGYFNQKEKELIYSRDFKDKVKDYDCLRYLRLKFEQAENLNLIEKLMSVDINSYLPEDLLVKTDIAGMVHSLEIRSPFLDHEFMELVARMPSKLKLNAYNKKYLLKKIAQKFLPKENINRSKQGFGVPLEHWFRGQLRNFLRESLLDSKFLSYGLFEKKEIERLIDFHLRDLKNYANHLWLLLILKEWLLVWFKKND